MKNQDISVLSNDETKEVSGGFPFFLVGFAARFATNQLVRHYASSASLAYGTYSWAKSNYN